VVSPGTEECSAVNYILCQQQKDIPADGKHFLSSVKEVSGYYAPAQVPVQQSSIYSGCDGNRPLFVNVSVGEVQGAEGSVEDTYAL